MGPVLSKMASTRLVKIPPQHLSRKPRVLTDVVSPSIQAQGKPFEIYAPENRYVFVSSKQHIMELDAAPDSVMSLHESAKQVSMILALAECSCGNLADGLEIFSSSNPCIQCTDSTGSTEHEQRVSGSFALSARS